MRPEAVRDLLGEHWDLADAVVTPLDGGMNSRTWDVRAGGRHWVLKSVAPRDRAGLESGLAAAERVDAAGIPAGAPQRTTSGHRSVDGHALLAFVDGVPLDGTGDDVRLLGETLGRVHAALPEPAVPGWPSWLDPTDPHLEVEPWVRPAVREALAAWRACTPRTYAFLHGDPAPEAFVRAPDGTCGLIDWASGQPGPCLYDLASAVMYVGAGATDRLVEAYLAHAPMPAGEVADGLDAALRLRWAVQAWYFALRVTEHDLTGLDDPSGNRQGLADARRALDA